jgi:hypothetical protein
MLMICLVTNTNSFIENKLWNVESNTRLNETIVG